MKNPIEYHITDLMDFNSWSNARGVVTVAMAKSARQPSSISLNTDNNR